MPRSVRSGPSRLDASHSSGGCSDCFIHPGACSSDAATEVGMLKPGGTPRQVAPGVAGV